MNHDLTVGQKLQKILESESTLKKANDLLSKMEALIKHDAAMTELCGEIIATMSLDRNRREMLSNSQYHDSTYSLFEIIDGYTQRYDKLEHGDETALGGAKRIHICQVCSANWDYQYSTGCPGCRDKDSPIV